MKKRKDEIVWYDNRTDNEVRGIRKYILTALYGEKLRRCWSRAHEELHGKLDRYADDFLKMYPSIDTYFSEYLKYISEEADRDVSWVTYGKKLRMRFKTHDGGSLPGFLAGVVRGAYGIVCDGISNFEI